MNVISGQNILYSAISRVGFESRDTSTQNFLSTQGQGVSVSLHVGLGILVLDTEFLYE